MLEASDRGAALERVTRGAARHYVSGDATRSPLAGMPSIPASLPPARCAGRGQGSRSDGRGRGRLALTPSRTPGTHGLAPVSTEKALATVACYLCSRDESWPRMPTWASDRSAHWQDRFPLATRIPNDLESLGIRHKDSVWVTLGRRRCSISLPLLLSSLLSVGARQRELTPLHLPCPRPALTHLAFASGTINADGTIFS